MACQVGNEGKPRHVFIVHYTDDIEFIEECIIEPLHGVKQDEDGLTVKCVHMHDYEECIFMPGRPTLDSIDEALLRCENTFVILTLSALERNWVKYETLQALEKSQREGRLCVALILVDLDETDAQFAWNGLITTDMIISVDRSVDNWQACLLRDMIKVIKEPRSLFPIRVAANLSVGQVWSHYFGYSSIVLPRLVEKIKQCTWYQGNEDRFPLIEFNLIPQSAETVRTLTDIHSSITKEGDLAAIITDRGSYSGRQYKPPVYSMERNGKKYYFIAHIPNTLSILSKLEKHDDQLGGGKLKISRGERSLQVARFLIAFNRLLNHPRNPQCNNLVRLINYHEGCTGEQIATCLLDAVIDECGQEQISQPMQNLFIVSKREEDFDRTVFVDYHEDCPNDVETGESLKQFLEQNGVKVWNEVRQGKTSMQYLGKAIAQVKWCVFIISKDALKQKDSKLLTTRCRTVVHQSVHENEVRVIPVFDGVDATDVPGDLSALTYLTKTPGSNKYMESLLAIIRCRSIKMEATVSAKDVHQGLAWAYCYNYLAVTLGDLDRIDKISKKYSECRVHKRLFLIIPSSCHSKMLKSLDKDENGRITDPDRFVQLPKEDITYSTNHTGGIVRDFQLIPYRLRAADGQVHVVFMEYVNPVRCMQEMVELSPLSGLNENDIDEEVFKFQGLLKNIISWESLDDKASVVYFDYKVMTLVHAMLQELNSDSR